MSPTTFRDSAVFGMPRDQSKPDRALQGCGKVGHSTKTDSQSVMQRVHDQNRKVSKVYNHEHRYVWVHILNKVSFASNLNAWLLAEAKVPRHRARNGTQKCDTHKPAQEELPGREWRTLGTCCVDRGDVVLGQGCITYGE
jgi:hypothetical protein